LNPEGLMLVVLGCQSPDEAEKLLENAKRWSKRDSRGSLWHSIA
jgi:ribosomal protein L35AE/L33A